MPVHHSAFVDFINVLIRYRSKQQCILELSVMATEMVSPMVFFPVMKFFFWSENLYKFCKCLLKGYAQHTF